MREADQQVGGAALAPSSRTWGKSGLVWMEGGRHPRYPRRGWQGGAGDRFSVRRRDREGKGFRYIGLRGDCCGG